MAIEHELLGTVPDQAALLQLSDFFKIIGDPTRLTILFALSNAELNVQDIALAAHMSVSAVSHQLNVLRKAGLVRFRRDGKYVIYRLDDSHVHGIVQLARDHLSEPRSFAQQESAGDHAL